MPDNISEHLIHEHEFLDMQDVSDVLCLLGSKKEEFPLKRCQRDGSRGWKWGDHGYCYTEKDEGSLEKAKKKAEKQGRAIKRRQQSVKPSEEYLL